jgi:hypothetical protein
MKLRVSSIPRPCALMAAYNGLAVIHNFAPNLCEGDSAFCVAHCHGRKEQVQGKAGDDVSCASSGGNDGMLSMHVCVERTRSPFWRWATMGTVVGSMFVAGVLVIRKWLVALELRMAPRLMVLVLVLIVLRRIEAGRS